MIPPSKGSKDFDAMDVRVQIKSTNRYALIKLFWYFLAEIPLVWLFITSPNLNLGLDPNLVSRIILATGFLIFILAGWRYLSIRSYTYVLTREQLKVVQ